MDAIWKYVFICVFTIGTIQAQEDIKKLEDLFNKKCTSVSGREEPFQTLRADVYEFNEFLKLTFDHLPQDKKTFCKEDRPNLNARIENIKNDLQRCVPDEETFFPDFIEESFKEFLHFLCHNNGENVKSFFSADAAICKERLMGFENDVTSCFNRIFKPQGNVLKKQDMCDDLRVAKRCFSDLLLSRCQHNVSFRDLSDTFFDYINKPCAGCIHYMSGVLLVAVLVSHWLFRY